MSRTLPVSKPLTSAAARLKQSENMEFMFVQLAVFHPLMSSVSRCTHSKNSPDISVTWNVSKPPRSSSLRFSQHMNIPCIFVIEDVSTLWNSMDVQEESPLKRQVQSPVRETSYRAIPVTFSRNGDAP